MDPDGIGDWRAGPRPIYTPHHSTTFLSSEPPTFSLQRRDADRKPRNQQRQHQEQQRQSQQPQTKSRKRRFEEFEMDNDAPVSQSDERSQTSSWLNPPELLKRLFETALNLFRKQEVVNLDGFLKQDVSYSVNNGSKRFRAMPGAWDPQSLPELPEQHIDATNIHILLDEHNISIPRDQPSPIHPAAPSQTHRDLLVHVKKQPLPDLIHATPTSQNLGAGIHSRSARRTPARRVSKHARYSSEHKKYSKKSPGKKEGRFLSSYPARQFGSTSAESLSEPGEANIIDALNTRLQRRPWLASSPDVKFNESYLGQRISPLGSSRVARDLTVPVPGGRGLLVRSTEGMADLKTVNHFNRVQSSMFQSHRRNQIRQWTPTPTPQEEQKRKSQGQRFQRHAPPRASTYTKRGFASSKDFPLVDRIAFVERRSDSPDAPFGYKEATPSEDAQLNTADHTAQSSTGAHTVGSQTHDAKATAVDGVQKTPLDLTNGTIPSTSEAKEEGIGRAEKTDKADAAVADSSSAESSKQGSTTDLLKELKIHEELAKEPIIRALPPEWANKVQEALNVQDLSATVTPESVKNPITRKDLKTLLPNSHSFDSTSGWLNDEIVNTYLAHMTQRRRHKANGEPADTPATNTPLYHAFTTFLYSTYRDKGYDGVKRWAKRAKLDGARLLDTEIVLIPINAGSHWILITVSGRNRSIDFYDSFNSLGTTYLDFAKDYVRRVLGDAFKEEEWTIGNKPSAVQLNGSDCGVFVCMNALAVISDRKPSESFDAGDMPNARRQIAATLLNGEFTGDFELV